MSLRFYASLYCLCLQVSQWKIWLRQHLRREFIWSSTDWVGNQVLRRLKVFRRILLNVVDPVLYTVGRVVTTNPYHLIT